MCPESSLMLISLLAHRPRAQTNISTPRFGSRASDLIMNSPIDRNSPGASDSSSDNDVEDITGPIEPPTLSTQQGPSGFFGGSSAPKRRLPGGLMFGGSSARDPKTRRKDVRPGGGGSYWDHMGPGPSRAMRDDLVDSHLVEQLRQRTFLHPCRATHCGGAQS